MDSLIIELQRDALNADISISNLLRKALVAAKKLKIQEFEKWIELELNGYYHLAELDWDCPENRLEKLPKYRWVDGELKVRLLLNQRLVPWTFESPEEGKRLSRRSVLDPIGVIETILDNKSSSLVKITFPDDLKLKLCEHLGDINSEPECHVPKSQFRKIQEAVRNIILEWALKLEENGILGEGLVFSANEKETASNITFNIKQLIQKGGTEMKVEISNSTVGMLNAGEIKQVESIAVNVSTLVDFNQHQIAEAFKNLIEAITASQDISSQQQLEILEQLELLSAQATLAPPGRKAGLIKPTLSALAATLSAGGGLAEIWSKWGNVIEGFFGIRG